ncbi:hypothetical protein Tco_0467833 [Tanacetum coccineum]
MAVLESCPKHNMVAYLEKTKGNAEFHEVIDFLARSSIHHALTVSPVVSTIFVEQFWMSAKSKIINNVRYITAKVAGKPVSISEASIRSDLLFDDVDGIDSLPNQAIFDAIRLIGYEGDLTVLTFNKALFSPQWSRKNTRLDKNSQKFKLRCNQHFSRDIFVLFQDKDTSQSKQNLQSFFEKHSFTNDLDYTIVLDSCLTPLRIVADFSHAPPNGYSPSPNDKKQEICLRKGCWFGGKLIQKLRQKGVYEESFSRHAAWIEEKLIQFMHTTMVPVQVKTMKIQSGVQVSRQGTFKSMHNYLYPLGHLHELDLTPIVAESDRELLSAGSIVIKPEQPRSLSMPPTN